MHYATRMDPLYQLLTQMSEGLIQLLGCATLSRDFHTGPAQYSIDRTRLRLGHDPADLRAFGPAFERFVSRYPPDETIRHGQATHYERWYLLPREPDAPRLYLHRFLSDDPGDLGEHDHPWYSASMLLTGSLVEHWRPHGASPTIHRDVIRPFHVIVRPPQLAHRLAIGEGQPVTLFATGPHVREWGFWRRDGRGSPTWTYWRDAA